MFGKIRKLERKLAEMKQELVDYERELDALESAALYLPDEMPMRRFKIHHPGWIDYIDAQYSVLQKDGTCAFLVDDGPKRVRLTGFSHAPSLCWATGKRTVAEFQDVQSVIEVPLGEG